MKKERVTLKQLLEQGPVLAPCVYDCFTALVLEKYGFKALCLSGGEAAASLVGVPDIGLCSFEEVYNLVNRITNVCSLPMIMDIDTGYGNELNVIRTCERAAQAGAMAVHLEDQVWPKRAGHMSGKQVIPIADYVGKIKAAKYALEGTDCLLIARTDAFHATNKEDAIQRMLAAREAGADLCFIDQPDTHEAIYEIAERVPGWKMFGMASYGGSPRMTFEELTKLGFNLCTLHFTMSAARLMMEKFAPIIKKEKNDFCLEAYLKEHPHRMTRHEIVGMNEWLELGAQFNASIKPAERIIAKD